MTDQTVGRTSGMRFVAIKTPVERFLEKVEKSDSCWYWLAGKDKNGYGRFRHNGWHGAHRFSYEHFMSPIPSGLVIDHICRIRHCVNPDHLRITTNKDNILTGIGFPACNSRKTRCKRGHLLEGVNIEIYHGRRCCLICRREQGKIYRDNRRG